MRVVFELWDDETNNLIDDYETEQAALADVLGHIEAHGFHAVDTWSLLRDCGSGPITMIARGADLARHATDSRLKVG
jgi:hypothetical protein